MQIRSVLVIAMGLGLVASCRADKSEHSEDKELVVAKPAEARNPIAKSAAPRDATVTSKDGTRIAFEQSGTGPALVIVSGALSHRAMPGVRPLAAALAHDFTIYLYDRRGRGESTDVQPYAVDREIEDLGALIEQAGGSAYVYGVSSGAALALQAAAKLGPDRVTKLALYEPPYGQPPAAYQKQKQQVDELVETGAPGDAAAAFLAAIGTPPPALDAMKRSKEWGAIAKMDFTLRYDFAVLGDGEIPQAAARAVTVPVLVLNGEQGPGFMGPTADRLASFMPHATRQTLAGQAHSAAPEVVAPVLTAFFDAR